MEVWAPLAPVWLAASVGGYAVAAYAVALRTLAGRGTATRWCGAFIFCTWALVVTFFALSPIHAFAAIPTALIGLAGWALSLAPGARRRSLVAQIHADATDAVAAWRSLGIPAQILLGGTLAFVLLVVLPRTLVLPPLGFDDMTYHLFKSGSWVNASGFTTSPAPDAWSYYDYFPASGEVVWAWFLLPARSGTFLGIAAIAAWGAALVGGFTVARMLGCSRDQSVTAATGIVTVAAALRPLETSYVDNLHLAGYLIGLALLLSTHRRFGWWSASATLMSFALVAGVKTSGLTPLALAAPWLAVITWRSQPRQRGLAVVKLAALGLVALLVCAPWYVRAAAERGSPLYPIAVPLMGQRLPANPQLAALFEGHFFGEQPHGTAVSRALDGVTLLEAVLRQDDISWPPAPFLWVAGALAGFAFTFLRRRNRAPATFLTLCAAAALYEVLSPSSFGLWNYFPTELGRLLLPALASLVLLTMLLPWGRWLIAAQLLVGAQLIASARAMVSAWTDAEQEALRHWAAATWPFALIGLGALVLALVARRAPRGARVALVGLAAAMAIVGIGAPLDATRAAERDAVFAANPRPSVCLAPMWKAVDDPDGHIVAVAAGFGGVGHNAHRFPYLGSRLSNRVVYVPITADGSFVDYRDHDAAARAMNEPAWINRLREDGVDYLAVLSPDPPEARAAERHPELFEKVATSTCDGSVLYRLRSV